MNHPTISIVVPTYNEEKNIQDCLESIFRQKYPKDKLEVLVIDDNSTDRTLEIAKKFPVKILISGKKHGEISKMTGFKAAKGEYCMYLDADNELANDSWFEQMLKPFQNHQNMVGVFTWEGARKSDSALERFLSFDSLQRDSLYQFFSPSIEDTLIEKKDGYWLLDYQEGKIPPSGRCLYKRELIQSLIKEYEMFLELDFLVLFASNGLNTFAYSYETGLYHHHAKTLHELLKKRKYNLNKVYLQRDKRFYKWFDLENANDLIKLSLWILYANLIIPSLAVGIYKSFKHKDWAGLYEPVVNLLVTDMLIFEFLKNPKGRNMFASLHNE